MREREREREGEEEEGGEMREEYLNAIEVEIMSVTPVTMGVTK